MSTPLVEQKPFNGHTPGKVFVFDDTIAARETPDDGGDIISSAPAEYECSMRRWQDNAAFLAHCWNTYYQREAELQSMRDRLSRMEEAGNAMARMFVKFEEEKRELGWMPTANDWDSMRNLASMWNAALSNK